MSQFNEKFYIFPKKFFYFFFDSCFYATAPKFRLLDYVIRLVGTILGMALKGLGRFCYQQYSFLVDKAYLRKVDACNHNDNYLNNILLLKFGNQTLF